MDKILNRFKDFCIDPKVNSGKATSYSNAIKYLCEYLNISIIDDNTIVKFQDLQTDIRNKNSKFYHEFKTFLINRQQDSYLTNGFVQAALNPFFKFWVSSYNEWLDNDDTVIQDKIIQSIPATLEQAEGSSNRELNITGLKNREAIIKDIKYSKYVLKDANYFCQIDNSHLTFLTKYGVQYMEGHHLIPCTVINAKHFSEKFNKNIDCIENIVCICPNCHRAVHLNFTPTGIQS